MRIERPVYLNELVRSRGNGSIKIVTGIVTIPIIQFLKDPNSLDL